MSQATISVIIPVYNAVLYIEKAIFSALKQPEVLEVIVINDGSTDGTLPLLKEIAKTISRITILSHKGGINKGRSASRNLGIKYAKGLYIAFLDADDYYLPNRFVNDFRIFKENPYCDGVYNAIGVHFYREATLEQQKELALYTVSEIIKPEDLFKNLLLGGKGHFSIDGLTITKQCAVKIDGFNTQLKVGEDTDFMWKLSLIAKLFPGNLSVPVSNRGVHDCNVFDNANLYRENSLQILESVLLWSALHEVPTRTMDLLLKQIWILKQKQNNTLLQDIHYWATLFVVRKKLLFSLLSIKYFPIIRYRQKLFPFLYAK